ncbi:MAG: phosphatase PAP2-related protein [bacterium]
MQTYKKYFSDKFYLESLFAGMVALFGSLIVNFYAGTYATERASNPVTDIVLSNTPVYDLDGFFVFGPIVLILFVALLCLIRPQKLPFILKSTALFVIIRSVFISITHIGPFPDQMTIVTGANIIKDFTFGGDLFFSAHTGLPFLMALIFYKNKTLRYLFIGIAVLFGGVVLLSHRHYSIDVLSAFFITYTIYNIGLRLFKRDVVLFNQE